MMPEISLNILDVAQNSVTAGASLTEISISIDTSEDVLAVSIKDNGCGMSEETIQKVTDPFYTTRTTRKVGLGIPFLKMAAEITGGSFTIASSQGEDDHGTVTTARFVYSSIDRMPLGDIAGTMTSLIGPNPNLEFVLNFQCDGAGFVMDTREFKAVLGDIPLSEPQVLAYIQGFIEENLSEFSINF